ncbi:MAG: hypothetical protein RBT84_17800, partial [FCB group bacterium]|nr:hypothetical protein [FCB group bacterium]
MLEVIGAACAAGRFPRPRQSRQQYGRQNAYDGNNDQEFNQRKPFFIRQILPVCDETTPILDAGNRLLPRYPWHT